MATFNAGRNAEKRAARASEAFLRKDAVSAALAGDFTVSTAKVRRSRLMVNMLADRRLRQRRGGM